MKKFLSTLLCPALFSMFAAEPARNIVFVGDSIACGVGASSKAKRFSTVAVAELNRKAGKELYKEVNLAWSGSTMSEQIWPSKGASGYPFHVKKAIAAKPYLLVIQHGVNDNATFRSVAEFAWNYRNFIREVRKAIPGCPIVCMTSCPGKYEKDRILYHEEQNAAIQEIAAQERTMVAQAALAIRNRLEFFRDGIHPNDDGHRILAEALVKAIEENDVKSPDHFDLVVTLPGTYRICGWRFQITGKGPDDRTPIIFNGFSKKGWTYSSPGPVRINSPYFCYAAEPSFRLQGTGKEAFAVKGSWHSYSKYGTLELPASDHAVVTLVPAGK